MARATLFVYAQPQAVNIWDVTITATRQQL